MYVINIALRREDKRVETDTVYAEKELTLDDVKSISERFNCDVIVSTVGTVEFFDDKVIKKKTMIFNCEVKDDDKKSE